MIMGKFRVLRVLLFTFVGTSIGIGYEAYQINLKYAALEQDTQGMDEFEVCHYALKKFGAEMMEDMGCLEPHQ